jgi:uncharacterized membrane protein
MLPTLFLPIVGVSIDAGVLFDARRDAQNVADGAARVAAMTLDREHLRRTGRARIDQPAAEREVNQYVSGTGFSAQRPAFQGDRGVRVTVERSVQPAFMRIFNKDAIAVRASGRAIACQGLQERDACS